MTKVCLVKGMVFPVVRYGCESWTIKKAECRRIDRLVIALLPRSKGLLISWLQTPSAVILEPPKIKSLTVSIVSPDALVLN